LQTAIRLAHKPLVSMLQRHWRVSQPDLVVSLIPNFNRAMCQALGSALPSVPYVTVLTDLADYPPRFWIEKDARQHLICGSARALAQARAAGCPESRLHAVSGMILHPRFYEMARGEREAERARLGLTPELPTGLVLFGGHGAPAMLRIARCLPDTQLLLICGHNARLAARLRALASRAPHVVLDYVRDMPQAMQLCDFFIGKPGPASISEAVQQRLPVIVTRNALTLPQERYNTLWVRQHQVGLVLKSFRQIEPAVQQMCERLEQFRQSTGEIRNRAVFEIPTILARILAQARWRLARPTAIAHTL
jgi:UDP-N-acetylglucosamine:LPS N-acetylglucosamine transferase